MIHVTIPGFGALRLEHLVLDYNGTLAVDGKMLAGIQERITLLAMSLTIHVVTGNTYGDAAERLIGLNCQVNCLEQDRQGEAKRHYVERLGANQTVAIGNGRNDAQMLKTAVLGIAVLGTEGLASDAAVNADILVRHAVDALGLLIEPRRLIASLRG